MKTRRCAIYTRKSSEEGLDQAFNSLDAQREACEAFIKSQAHEGWTLVKATYDDGGFSGGSMERPAVQRLLADVQQGLVNVIVVYKVDRLTRSLADFAKIVETLDGHGASFVSVTQQFNTTSSMGRLTLNVLLSFAQFEREVAGERIRDKIALSKRKGMWMGGNPPLGYDVKDRLLVINDAEAETVGLIFRRYLELGCVHELAADLTQCGVVSKRWVSSRGNTRGGYPYSRGALYYLLHNVIYVGRISHRGASYPGQHVPIVEQALWDEVQAGLAGNRTGAIRRPTAPGPALLAGLLYDEQGHRMSPSHTRKKGRQYRYYVSQAILQGRSTPAGTIGRISAMAIEGLVEQQLQEWLPREQQARWRGLPQKARRDELNRLVERAVVRANSIDMHLTATGLASRSAAGFESPEDGVVRFETAIVRRHRARVVLTRDELERRQPDRTMLKAIAQAHHLRRRLETDHAVSLQDLANDAGCTRPYLSVLLRLAYLSPSITQAILEGRQPPHMTLGDLLKHPIPLSWAAQHEAFGF